MPEFAVRALEIHSQYAWDFKWVRKSLAFMGRNDLNSLVLHRNDIVDKIVFPSNYFGGDRESYKNIFERYQDIFRTLYKYTPIRRSRPLQRRDYLKRVIEEANQQGIEVYLQNKELWFPDVFLEFFPQLQKDGKVCPTEPFWWEFVRTKYTQLFEELPELAGIITSPATGESKVSISSSRCTCERCRSTNPEDWYSELLAAMYEPTVAAGKRLVVRDFVFDKKNQDDVGRTMEGLPADVVVMLKNTPHDYYPTFPHNPRIGKIGNHEQWIEFDCMAQYFGWGIVPSIMLDDMRERLAYARQHDAKGAIFRTDWEGLEAHSAFDTYNILNLYGGAALSADLEATDLEIYTRWLQDEGAYTPSLSQKEQEAATAWVAGIFGRTWGVVKRSLYTHECVFSDSSTFPVSLEHALWLAEEKNSLKDWDASKAMALSLDEGNVQSILREKDEAVTIATELLADTRKGHAGLTPGFLENLEANFDIALRYARAFRAIGHAVILTRVVLHGDEGAPGFVGKAREQLEERLQELLSLAEEFERFYHQTAFPHTVYIILSPERLRALHDDLRSHLGEAKAGSL